MSSVLKNKLPRPSKYVECEAMNEGEKLIFEQLKILIQHDNYKYPI